MADWTNEELKAIETAEELEIAGRRKDGTLHSYRTIWVVRVSDSLYVRSVDGRGSAWFRGILTCHQGRIQAGGVESDVIFEEETNPSIHEQIDAAYRKKYSLYPKIYVDNCVTQNARTATVKPVPRP